MPKTSPTPKRKNSKVDSFSLGQDAKKVTHISQKRGTEKGATEYFVKHEHSNEFAWVPDHEVDEDLMKQFEVSLNTSTPLRRGRSKLGSLVVPPVSDRKRKLNDGGLESKRLRKDSPSPTDPIPRPSTPPTPTTPTTPTTPSDSEHLRRGKSILTIDVNLRPVPPNSTEEEVEGKTKKGRKKGKPKKLVKKGDSPPTTPKLEELGSSFVSLRVGHVSLKGYRPTMEDAHAIMQDLTINITHNKYAGNPVHYFAVYDGHGGDKVAIYLADKLHHKIFSNELFLQGNFQQAYYNTFADTDIEVNQAGWGGSTAACALLVGNTLTVANLGDAEVVLGYKRKADAADPNSGFGNAVLTHNVKPEDGQEARRVEAGGGHIAIQRVNGEVAVSRAFGDVTYKRPTWRTDLISAVPFVNQIELYPQDRFLIISCDGLYEAEVFTHESAVDYIGHLIKNKITDPNVMAKKIADEAITRGSRDNVTVIVVLLSHN